MTEEYTLEERIVELEQHVKEIGNVLYELMEELRGQQEFSALPIPVCPPICPRD
jgi:hypothetical protein